MIRRCLAGLLGLVLVVGVVLAEETTGKITAVDTDKNVIKIKDAKDKVHIFKVIDSTKFVGSDDKELEDGIKSKKLKADVTIVVTEDGKKKNKMTKEVKIKKDE